MEATPMRKVMIALSTLAAIGIAMPVMTGAAQAETKKIIMKKAIAAITKGWRHHHHGTKVAIKNDHHD
jgi:hypothetical protein